METNKSGSNSFPDTVVGQGIPALGQLGMRDGWSRQRRKEHPGGPQILSMLPAPTGLKRLVITLADTLKEDFVPNFRKSLETNRSLTHIDSNHKNLLLGMRRL